MDIGGIQGKSGVFISVRGKEPAVVNNWPAQCDSDIPKHPAMSKDSPSSPCDPMSHSMPRMSRGDWQDTFLDLFIDDDFIVQSFGHKVHV